MLHNILCLGDSYTIGEGVPIHDNFPYLLLQLLRKNGFQFNAPEIIAKTGWTSFELLDHLQNTIVNNTYSFVTLLIGVNNQYRGLSTEDFANDFELLLKKSINWADNNHKKVIVISIPDWGVTPFAEANNEHKIANEIDAFNGVCEMLAQKYQAHYVEITKGTRLAKTNLQLLTQDKLHYSSIEHLNWAKKILEVIKENI